MIILLKTTNFPALRLFSFIVIISFILLSEPFQELLSLCTLRHTRIEIKNGSVADSATAKVENNSTTVYSFENNSKLYTR